MLALGLCVPVNAINTKRSAVNIKKLVLKTQSKKTSLEPELKVAATAVCLVIISSIVIYFICLNYNDKIDMLQKNIRTARQEAQ